MERGYHTGGAASDSAGFPAHSYAASLALGPAGAWDASRSLRQPSSLYFQSPHYTWPLQNCLIAAVYPHGTFPRSRRLHTSSH